MLKSEGPIVDPIETHYVSGSSTELAPYLAEEMTQGKRLAEKQAVILSAYLLSLAEQYADGVGQPFHVLVLRPKGETEQFVYSDMDAIIEHTADLQREFNTLLLSAPDLSLPDAEIDALVTEFTGWVKGLREVQKEFQEIGLTYDRSKADILHKI